MREADAGPLDGLLHRRRPPAVPAGQDQQGVGMPAGHPGERPDQGRDVLAGLQGPDEEEVGPAVDQAEVDGGQQRPVGSGTGLVGPEPAGVDAVGGYEDLGVDAGTIGPARRPSRGSGRPRPRPGGPPGRWPDGTAGPWTAGATAGASKKLRSWTVTTVGTVVRSGMV